MDFIIEREEDDRPLYLTARVPGVVTSWGRVRDEAKRLGEAEACELAAAMNAAPFYAGTQVKAVPA